MSTDPIFTLAYTYDEGKRRTEADAVAAITRHLPAITTLLTSNEDVEVALDLAGGAAWPEEAASTDEQLVDILRYGYLAHADDQDLSPEWHIPGTTGLYFALRSEENYENSDLYALLLLINLVDALPALGADLGILGGGIVIPGANR